ncbi:MAG: caspase family protein [Rhizobiaceae bacterium]|nr:caspase family protein [Rhizobiaceae bacterium]
MTKKLVKSDTPLGAINRVVAIVVGIENYQKRKTGELPKVDHAHDDAREFSDVLKDAFDTDKLDLHLLLDHDATLTSLQDQLGYMIKGLKKDDLFIFYYAGHGFHGAGGNRITAFDSNAFNIADTTLLVGERLIEPLNNSKCERSLLFVDACASEFKPIVAGRDVVSDLSSEELEKFLQSAIYCGLFLSCSPGEKSYPSTKLRHGVWTSFLLKALRGEAPEALTKDRYLTDSSLRDYLRQEVPRYVTHELSVAGTQTPQAIITASNTFAIRHIPEPPAIIAGDFSSIKLVARREYFEGIETGKISTMSGFHKGHRVPDSVNDYTNNFVMTLAAEQITQEIQELYEKAKPILKLRRKDTRSESSDGEGNLDTPFFRYIAFARQDPSEASNYQIVRELELRQDIETIRDQIDSIFNNRFQRVVMDIDSSELDFDDLVDSLEDIEEAIGGILRDNESASTISYTLPDGPILEIDLATGRLSLGSHTRRLCSELLIEARQYRFGISGQTRLLLS